MITSSKLLQRNLRKYRYTADCRHCSSGAVSYKDNIYDVVVVGGGATGSIFASHLAREIPSLKVSVLDSRKPRSLDEIYGINQSTKTEALPSPRAYALSPKSLNMLPANVLREMIDAGRVSFYDKMQIWESDGPSVLHFTHHDVFDAKRNFGHLNSLVINTLGAVIEDEPMVASIWKDLEKNSQVHLISDASISKISTHPDKFSSTLILDDARVISTKLLVAADGANSFVRKALGTFPLMSYSYGRKAITCTVEIDKSMQQTAYQRFQPNGPIALLPIWEEHVANRLGNCGDKIYANIVWSTTPEEAAEVSNLGDSDFIERINNLLQSGPTLSPSLFPDHLKSSIPTPLANALNGFENIIRGANTGLSVSGMSERELGFSVPPMVISVVGKRVDFDLNLMNCKKYVGPRVALLGDAAHTIHPMAGQGLNLGFGDAECLARNLKIAVECGMGIAGDAGLEYSLQQYENERQREVLATIGGIQFLHSAFGTTFSPAITLRSIGMNLINSLGPVRGQLARIATGLHRDS